MHARCSLVLSFAVLTGCGFVLGDPGIGESDMPAARPEPDASVDEDTPPGPPPDDTQTDPPPAPGTPDAGATDASTGTDLLVFVTSARKNGDLGGLAGADAWCNELAKAANRPGTYRAWLSTAAESAATRITSNGPWKRADGQLVAQDKARLLSGNLAQDIDVDEKNEKAPATDDRVWTATSADGKHVGGDDCGGWTSATGNGRVGEAAHENAQWTDIQNESCSSLRRVYCFQL